MLIQMKCPQCGAEMGFDNSRDFMFCSFCGAKIANITEKKDISITQNVNVSGTVVHKRDTSNDPNLIIEFASTNLSYTLLTHVINEQWVYTNGQSKTYRLRPGRYVIRFSIANRKWDRTIYIPNDNSPVSIRVVFSGRTNIYISQPPQGFNDYQNLQNMQRQYAMQIKAEKERIKTEKKAEKALKKQGNNTNLPVQAPTIPSFLYCPNCGNKIYQGQIFCAKCGKRFR